MIGWTEIAVIAVLVLLLAACVAVLLLAARWVVRGYDPRRAGKRRFHDGDQATREADLKGLAAWYAGDEGERRDGEGTDRRDSTAADRRDGTVDPR
ncbi:hypothetical protein [Corynebacterium frankenforstense]|nr:hypothetical protein [Corynebacterium frankenforstense]